MAHKGNVPFFKTVVFDVTGTEINMSVSDTQATELGGNLAANKDFFFFVQLLCESAVSVFQKKCSSKCVKHVSKGSPGSKNNSFEISSGKKKSALCLL